MDSKEDDLEHAVVHNGDDSTFPVVLTVTDRAGATDETRVEIRVGKGDLLLVVQREGGNGEIEVQEVSRQK